MLQIHGFYLYIEYAANYKSVSHKLTMASRSLPTWEIYERGVEGLMNSIFPSKDPERLPQKSLSFEDLLIKVVINHQVPVLFVSLLTFRQPIQRICRYPLFFSELQKTFSAGENPNVGDLLRGLVKRFHELAQEVDKAIEDSSVQDHVRKSRLLYELLKLPSMV